MSPADKLSLLCIFVSSIAAVPIDIRDAKNLIHLNDDCLYGTLAYLDFESLGSLAKSNRRFEFIVNQVIDDRFFATKAQHFIESWNKNATDIDRNVSALEASAIEFIRECIPNDRVWNGEKLVLLFKFAALMNQIDFGKVKWFARPSSSFKNVLMLEESQIEQFAPILTPYDHFNIISYFRKFWVKNSPALRWMCYAYMVTVRSSKHLSLNNRPSMMQHVKEIRNAANVQYLRHMYDSIPAATTGNEKFKLDWNL